MGRFGWGGREDERRTSWAAIHKWVEAAAAGSGDGPWLNRVGSAQEEEKMGEEEERRERGRRKRKKEDKGQNRLFIGFLSLQLENNIILVSVSYNQYPQNFNVFLDIHQQMPKGGKVECLIANFVKKKSY